MKTIKDVGSLAYMVDKWDVKKSEKGHKLINYAGRCVAIPDDAAALHWEARRKVRVPS